MAHCLEEISSHKSSTDSERVLSNNEWEKLQETHQQTGFREGISYSRDLHLQEGFVNGFRSSLQHCVTIGYLKGLISPYQQDSWKNPEADALQSKLEQMKQALVADEAHTTTNIDVMTIEDIVKTCNKDTTNLYLQCKNLTKLNHMQS